MDLRLKDIKLFFKAMIEARKSKVLLLEKEIRTVKRKNDQDLEQYNRLKTTEITIEVNRKILLNTHD